MTRPLTIRGWQPPLNPNYDLVVVQQGELLTCQDGRTRVLKRIKKAMRLNPYQSERFWNHPPAHAIAPRNMPKPPAASSRITRLSSTTPTMPSPAATFPGDGERGTWPLRTRQRFWKREPKFSVAVYLTTQHYKRDVDRKRHEAWHSSCRPASLTSTNGWAPYAVL